MKTYTLTQADLERYADTARRGQARFADQYAQLRRAFCNVTDAQIEAMIPRVVADPNLHTRKAPIDVAVFFCALYTTSARRVRADIDLLVSGDPTVATFQTVFAVSLQCADALNALTLLLDGGLATQAHLEEMAPVINATNAALKRHAATNAAKEWVQKQWESKGAAEYDNNKSEFARKYVDLVPLEHPGVTVTWKVLKDRWLP